MKNNLKDDPAPGTIWRHYTNQNLYIVLGIANAKTDPNDLQRSLRYPRTVVYMNCSNMELYAGRADDWHRRMTQEINPNSSK